MSARLKELMARGTALLGSEVAIICGAMSWVSERNLVAAVSNAGALGSIGVAATDAAGAREMIAVVRALCTRPFNVNVFVHQPVPQNAAREKAWLSAMAPLFDRYGARPPTALRPIYKSFIEDDEMLELLIDTAPAVVSFHFGLPDAGRISALKDAGCVLLATATNLDEALAAKTAGIDAVVAQGWEAGGHRGIS